MPHTSLERTAALLTTNRSTIPQQQPARDPATSKGFGTGAAAPLRQRRTAGKRRSALSKADWGPLGQHPNLEAIIARQRLHLPLSGRLNEAQVNQAWKRCTSEHHPDRGGEHDTMQLVNGARDILLGRNIG